MRWALVLALALAGCKKKPPVAASEPEPAPVEASAGPAAEPAGAAGETAPVRVDRAVSLLQSDSRDDHLRARDLLIEVTRSHPDDPAARLALGTALYRVGDVDGAISELSRLTREHPELSAAWRYLALAEVAVGEDEAALRHLRTGIERSPNDVDLRVALVSVLRRLGQTQEAVSAAQAALKINARSLPVYHEMGAAWFDAGDLDRARFVYEKASTILGADANADIQAGFGWVLLRRGERYTAELRLKKALEIDGRNLLALLGMAAIYAEDRNWKGALPLLEEAGRLNPRDAGVQLALGNALRGLARLDDAEAAYRKALQLAPGDPTPHFNLGVLLGDDKKAYGDGVKELKAYVSAGGAESTLATTYIDDFERAEKRASQRKKAAEDRARREKERAEREALLKAEAEKAPAAPEPAPEGEAPPVDNGPWGPTGGGQ